MKNDLLPLLKLELMNLWGINRFIHLKDKKEKNKSFWLAVAYVFCAVVMIAYIGGYCYGLVYLGLGDLIPAYLITISGLFSLILGILKTGNYIFQKKGYDLVCALPISKRNIVLSRFLRLYIENILFSVLVFVPGFLVYVYFVNPGLNFYMIALLIIVFSSLLPMIISIIFGSVVAWISSRMKHKSLVETALTILLVLLILGGTTLLSSVSQEIDLSDFSQLIMTIYNQLAKIYPPSVYLGNALVEGSILSALYYIIGIILAFIMMVEVVIRYIDEIIQNLSVTYTKSNYKLEVNAKTSVLKTLVVKEFKRYFASSIYVTNTIIGPILSTAAAFSLLFIDLNSYFILPFDIKLVLPILIPSIFVMMNPTCVSISMEGKQWWLTKSLPISTKLFIDSKILMTLILMFPFLVVVEICLLLALQPSGLDVLFTIIMPIIIILFSSVFGLAINFKFYQFDWESDITVVKQSASTLIGGLGGSLIVILSAIILMVVPKQWIYLTKTCICAVLIGMTYSLYQLIQKIKLESM